MSFVACGDHVRLLEYLDRMLYEKGLGTDGCARPMAARDQQDMKKETSCYAEGYIRKTIEFVENCNQMWPPRKTVDKTLTYLKKLQKEMTEFFSNQGVSHVGKPAGNQR